MVGIHAMGMRLSILFAVAGLAANFEQSLSSRQVYDKTLSTASLCEARSVNYITQSLPQACLASIWPSSTSWSTTQEVESPTTASNIVRTPSATSTKNVTETSQPGDDTATSTSTEPEESSFMSFEDWKEMMLKKTGQDPLEMRSRGFRDASAVDRTPPDGGYGELGEEDEISLNFNNLGIHEEAWDSNDSYNQDHGREVEEKGVTPEGGGGSVSRSKDAGKTCKERFSYSSFDAGATVIRTGPATKNAKAILVENKDSYMLLECAQNKFVIIELSDDIMIDTVVLANFEFFSSMIRHFRVSVSDRYPVKIDKWKDPRVFQARNSRDIQPFLVENPQIWAKYVRIEFLTHYGNEYYCPISLLRVHGTRMLDSWKDSETGREDDGHEERDDSQQPPEIEIEQTWSRHTGGEPDPGKQDYSETAVEGMHTAVVNESDVDIRPHRVDSTSGDMTWSPIPRKDDYERPPPTSTTGFFLTWQTCAASTITATTNLTTPTSLVSADASYGSNTELAASHRSGDEAKSSGGVTKAKSTIRSITSHSSSDQSQKQPSMPTDKSEPRLNAHGSLSPNISSSSSGSAADTQMPAANLNTLSKGASSKSSEVSRPPLSKGPSPKNSISSTPTSKTRGNGTAITSTSSPVAQQGFFNSVTKRLQQVEANLTLSLKYIEDQSRHIQDSLLRAEQKQAGKAGRFLDTLNQTVLSELREIREQYDQIWQSTVIALDTQKDHSERDIVALSTRLNLLADEVVFQKRMAILQAILLLSCLFLVIFSRGASIPYLGPLLEPSPPSVRNGSTATTMRSPSMFGNGLDYHDAASSPDDSPPAPVRAHHGVCRSNISASSVFDAKVHESADQRRERLAPPLTMGRVVNERDDYVPKPGYEEPSSVVRRPQHTQSRKPLPALPEHPSSPEH